MSYINQIFISDNDDQELSDILKYSTETVKNCYPECEYVLYNNSMIRNFISDHFDEEVLWTYDKLKGYSSKSNLGRYCIAYIKGGWYADITVKMVSRFDNYSNFEFICFGEGNGISPTTKKFGLSTSLFYTKPKNLIFKKCIEMVVENCKNKYYGVYPTEPTGPGVFALCYLKHRHIFGTKNTILSKCVEGMCMYLTPEHYHKNTSFVLPDGWIIAQFKDAWNSSNIFDYGVTGLNNYRKFWACGNFYSEKDE